MSLMADSESDVEFSRKQLRTPEEMKVEITKEKELIRLKEERFITMFRPSLEEDLALLDMKKSNQTQQQTQTGSRRSRNRRGGDSRLGGYHIKKQNSGQFLRSDHERKNQLDFAVQRKKDMMNIRKSMRPISRNSVSEQDDKPTSQILQQIQQAQSNVLTESPQVNHGVSAEQMFESALGKTDHDLQRFHGKYFGQEAILSFNEKFKQAGRLLERYPNEKDLPEELKTPRSIYLRGVEKSNLLPLPLLIRSENAPLTLDLGRRGLGDLRVKPIIDVIDELPALHSINLSDNRLTDVTLMPLASKLPLMETLTYLDLSFNKIDECSHTIMDYLRSESCKLRSLILNGADVDDQECVNLASAISQNKSLKTLSLSRNLIGKAELLNVLHPDLVTGGEALGQMLRANNTLTKLDLSWNSIRLDSAIALSKSLEVNQTIRVLLLGYNSFGDMPSQYLGKALKINKSLTELDLESNSINPKAATVLANAISFNETLLKLNINGNTLGKIGAQALVAAIQRSSTESRKLQVSFVNCDCSKDDDNIFSAANPHGTWRMNLREPYGQMVAAECLYLANYKAGCRIVRILHNGNPVTLERSYVASADEGEAGAQKKFKLEEFYKNCRLAANELLASNFVESSKYLNNLLTQFGFRMDEENRLSVLKKTQELWVAKAKREGRDVRFPIFVVIWPLLIMRFI
jgi:Ran GTPase-activating protein (RanGAP) involved in mRNA processing and transport